MYLGHKKLHYPNDKDDFSNQKQMIADPGDLVFLMEIVGMEHHPTISNHQSCFINRVFTKIYKTC